MGMSNSQSNGIFTDPSLAGVWIVPDEAGCEKIKLLRQRAFTDALEGVKKKIEFDPHIALLSFGDVVSSDEMATIIRAGRKVDAGPDATPVQPLTAVDLNFQGIHAKNTFYRSGMMQVNQSVPLLALLDYFADVLKLDKANDTPEIEALRAKIANDPERKDKLNRFDGQAKKKDRKKKEWPHISILYLDHEDRGNTAAEEVELENNKLDQLQKIAKPKQETIIQPLKAAYEKLSKVPGFATCKAKEIWVTQCPNTETEQIAGSDKWRMKTWEAYEKHRIPLKDIPGLAEFVDAYKKKQAEKAKEKAKK